MQIPKLKGNPFQADDYEELKETSFESTFDLSQAKSTRIAMWLLVSGNAINCFITGKLLYEQITSQTKFQSDYGITLPSNFTLFSLLLIPLAICLGTFGHILWVCSGSLIKSRTKVRFSLLLWTASILIPICFIFFVVPLIVVEAGAGTNGVIAGMTATFPVFLIAYWLWLSSLHFMARELKDLSSIVRREKLLEPALIEIGALVAGVTNFLVPTLEVFGTLGLFLLSLGIASTAFACAQGCSQLIAQRNKR